MNDNIIESRILNQIGAEIFWRHTSEEDQVIIIQKAIAKFRKETAEPLIASKKQCDRIKTIIHSIIRHNDRIRKRQTDLDDDHTDLNPLNGFTRCRCVDGYTEFLHSLTSEEKTFCEKIYIQKVLEDESYIAKEDCYRDYELTRLHTSVRSKARVAFDNPKLKLTIRGRAKYLKKLREKKGS